MLTAHQKRRATNAQAQYTHCIGGPCENGAKLCPCPEACQRLDRHGREINRYSRIGAELAAWVLAVLVIVALVHLGMRLYDMARPVRAAVDCGVKTT